MRKLLVFSCFQQKMPKTSKNIFQIFVKKAVFLPKRMRKRGFWGGLVDG
jgi:hypothetical protein